MDSGQRFSSSRYRKTAQTISQKIAAAPFKPSETFVKWVEFAAEFPDLTELNLVGAEMDFFVYHSFDVIVPAIVVLFLALYIVVSITQRVVASITSYCTKQKLE